MLMKKIFTLIGMALVTLGASAQTLINYPVSKDGITLKTTDTDQICYGSTKINTNTNTVDGIKFGKTFKYAEADEYYYATLTTEGGFKAGDVISITGVFNNADDTKQAAIKFYSDPAGDPIWTTENFINGRTAAEDPVAQTFTLTADAATLYFGRQGNTGTFVLALTVTRGGAAVPEIWRADDLTFDETTKVVQPKADGSVTYEVTEISNSNFFSVPQDKKIYPEGTYAAGGVDVLPADGTPITMKSYELTIKTDHMTLHAVSTPNTDASENEGWQLGGGGTNGLNTAECAVKFEKYIKPKNGNPSIAYKEYYEETSTGTSFRVSETLWEPEFGVMPAKGLYYEFTPSADGDLLLALIVWRPKNHVYVFEKSTMTQFPVSALSVDGYANQNTVIWGTNTTAYTTMTMNDTHDYLVDGIPDKPMFGYMTLKNLEANKTYVLLSKDGQPGIYGFQFTPGGDPSGVEVITSKTNNTWNANAPMYNLSGQQVDRSYKGIVIQNGRKLVNK